MSATAKRIGFVLSSNSASPLPSTRISVLNMLPHLKSAGYDPVIVFEPENESEMPELSGVARQMQTCGIDIAYFQKVHGPSVHAQLSLLRQAGIRTVYGTCDRVDDEMVQSTDATVIVTEFLKRQHAPELQTRIHVVHDGIEHPEWCRASTGAAAARRLRAVLVTSATLEAIPVLGRLPRNLDLTVVGRYPEHVKLLNELRTRLRHMVHNTDRFSIRPLLGYGFRVRAWHPARVYEEILHADIGIIPIDMSFDPLPGREVSYWEVKSENRLTLKMALGLPVIASPVPAYLDVIQQGVNGYIARTRAEWLDALEALRDPQHRQQIGTAARETVLDRFSMERQARKLIIVLDALAVDSVGDAMADESLNFGSRSKIIPAVRDGPI